MAISRLSIENFRSIELLDVNLSSVNALIGANNAGKSNILRALNIILGETWPTRPFAERDYFNLDLARTIEIRVLFQSPLACDPTVHGFQLSCSFGQSPEFYAIDASGNALSWPNGSPKRVNSVMREEAALVFLGLDRDADTQLRTTQWTLYGKLLRRIEGTLTSASKSTFLSEVSMSYRAHIEPALAAAQTIMDDLVRRQTGLNVQLELQTLDPLEVLKSVRPRVSESGFMVDPEQCGAGVQGAIAVAVAKAYADIVKNPVILAIEEPELYLHPHGCRHFYRLLREFAGAGLQVIYTTHDRSFVNVGDFDSVHIVRKSAGQTEVISGRNLHIAGANSLRIQSRFNERVNEAFFASAVVLVEGDPDEIACRAALEALTVDLDGRSISVIPVGGQTEAPVFAELLAGLQIPTFALMDEDPGNAASAAIRARLSGFLPAANIVLQSPNLEDMWGLPNKPSKVGAMTIFPAESSRGNIPQPYRELEVLLQAAAP